MKLVLRLLLLTLAAFLSSLFASPEAEGVGWKTAPDDEVRQHGDGQHEYAGPEAEWKGEKRRVPDGKRAEQFFSETLEDAGENGPSAREPREQCRINGWLNYDTTSGCTVAARTPNVTKEVVTRPNPGRDGATSRMIRERTDGQTTSVTHQVTSPDGRVIHQHQTHVGRHGTERRFPDEWVEYPTIPPSP